MATRAALVSVIAALAAAAPAASPADALVGLQQFTVEQVPKIGISPKAYGPVAHAHDRAKKGAPVSDNLAAAAAAAAQSGSVAANPTQYDSEYIEKVTVGSQTLNLDFDTGSSDLWVFSSLQSSSQRSGHNYYTPGSAKRQSGETWKISYGDGSGASGVVYTDKVVIGGVTATSQAVEAATSASSAFVQGDNDGLVGLAFPNINTCSPNACRTFMQNVGSSLSSNLFTSSLKKGKAGTYDFGYIDSSKYTGSISYTSVSTANGFWEFTASGYKVGSKTYSASLDSIMDTGTTLVYLPDSVISNYYAQVSGAQNSQAAGGYIFPCSATLPSFSVSIGGAYHTIPGSYINYAPNGDGTCYGGIQSADGIGFNIFGDIFIKSQFVVFDVGNTRLGVATPSS